VKQDYSLNGQLYLFVTILIQKA